jgi:hypothetical protein
MISTRLKLKPYKIVNIHSRRGNGYRVLVMEVLWVFLSLTQISQQVFMCLPSESMNVTVQAGHTVRLSSTAELLNYSHCFAHRVIKDITTS